MILISFFLSYFVSAESILVSWENVHDVQDKHEFYGNNEAIIKPKDAWQTLFSLVFYDMNTREAKDCVFFKVPGNDAGILKFKTVHVKDSCDSHILEPGEKEITGIKSLQFSITLNEVKISFSNVDFKSENWIIPLRQKSVKKLPEMHLSSAEFKSSKLVFLSSKSVSLSHADSVQKKDHDLCHDINEDCEEVSPSYCLNCRSGWYEIPNGCTQGPKYCGILNCGGKNRPACRRGMRWQRKESTFDCRTDSSFAYCSKGNFIQCEGKKAFCR
jgi:hypothetical protein